MKQHEFGFWQHDPIPSPIELEEFYKKIYFDTPNFEKKYDEEEFFHKQVNFIESEFVFNEYRKDFEDKLNYKFLDVGCGEGFSLNYFNSKNWDVYGTDYTRTGIERQFPQLASRVVFGDTNQALTQYLEKGKRFDLIILNNVLEHLLQPIETLNILKHLLEPNGVLKVQVPNDFSEMQKRAMELGFIKKEFWIIYEHINYFNKDSLLNTFAQLGFSKTEVLGDYPIDFNLFNPDSNYILDKSKGKNCHRERIHIENLLARKSAADFVAFRRGCGQAGIGRNVIVYGRL